MKRFRLSDEKDKPKKPKQPKTGPFASSDVQVSSSSDAVVSSSEPGSSKTNRRLTALHAAKAFEKTGKRNQKGIFKKSEGPAEMPSSSSSSPLKMQPRSLPSSESTSSQSTLSSWKSSQSTVSPTSSQSSSPSSSQSSKASELSTASSRLSTESSSRRSLEQQVEKAEESDEPIYDDKGVHIATGLDICDCLHELCPGCFLACLKCGSKKCGSECRVNRRFLVQSVDYRKTI